MSQDVDIVLQRNSIESYISKFVSLKKRGKNYLGVCPFHNEKTPSFTVSPEKQIFKCFGCGKGGNLITFVQEYERISFFEALKILADLSEITLSNKSSKISGNSETDSLKNKLYAINEWIKVLFIEEYKNSDEAKKYFQQRNVASKLIDYFQIGYSPNILRFIEYKIKEKFANQFEEYQKYCITLGILGNSEYGVFNRFKKRVMFPLHDVNGKCIGFSGRTIEEIDNKGKYINSPDSVLFHKKYHLYHLEKAKDYIRKEKNVVLVEGYIDVLGFVEKDIFSVVGTMGTAFSIEQAKLLKRYVDTICLFFDHDSAGIEATYKAISVCRQVKLDIKILFFEDTEKKLDPFDYCREHTKEELRQFIQNAKSELDFILWYCVVHKFNITTSYGKRECINLFFTYVQEISDDWEKEYSIKQLSQKIFGEVSESLWSDFKKFEKKIPLYFKPESKKQLVRQNEMPKSELEILSIIIRFPSLLHDLIFSQSLIWSSSHVEVLFSLLYKKIIHEKNTVIKIHQLGEILTPELFALLTQVIVMDNIFLENEEYLQKNNLSPEKYYLDRLNILIEHQRIDYLNGEVKRLQNIFGASELSEQDDIVNQINQYMKEINRLKYNKKI